MCQDLNEEFAISASDVMSDSEIVDEEPCCVFESAVPPRENRNRGIEILQWAQCDGIRGRKACKP